MLIPSHILNQVQFLFYFGAVIDKNLLAVLYFTSVSLN